jgi:nitrogen fixation protein FixH
MTAAPTHRYMAVRADGTLAFGKTIPADRIALIQLDDGYQLERLRGVMRYLLRDAASKPILTIRAVAEAPNAVHRARLVARYIDTVELIATEKLRPGAWRVLVRSDNG